MPWLTPDGPVSNTYACRRVRVPDNLQFVAALSGALLPLISSDNWEEFGTLSAEQAADALRPLILEAINSEDWCVIGVIVPYATAALPAHTLPCDGAIYNRVDYPLLYAALDPAFIVDADTFKTPDLVERFPLGAGLSPTSPYQAGTRGGEDEVTLTIAELPAHTHDGIPHGHTTIPHSHSTLPHTHSEITALPIVTTIGLEAPEPSAVPGVGLTSASGVTVFDSGVTVTDSTASVTSTGGGEAHNNMPPFLALKWCIYYE